MTDHEKFKALQLKLDLPNKRLAELMGFTHDSVKSMVTPSKPLPKWAKSMLIVYEMIAEK